MIEGNLVRVYFISAMMIISSIFSGCLSNDDEDSENIDLYGTEYKDPPLAPDFLLKNQFGEDVSLSDFSNKVVVVAFVYTSCPDICLIISSNLDYIKNNLDNYNDSIEIISITIDPARDTISHLAEWTGKRGYEWNHLTSENGSKINSVWDDWNVVVDSSHIENSLPPDGKTLRFSVLFPDNTTLVTDSSCLSNYANSCFSEMNSFAEFALKDGAGINYDLNNGTIGNWTENSNWSWELYSWDTIYENWTVVDPNSIDEIDIDTNLAWVANNSNITLLPPGQDCNGHGWIMGSGSGAHCMCDEGWKRPSGDWLSCISDGDNENNDISNSSEQQNSDNEELDPHDESLLEYEVGHSTVTFIVDKEQRKRVAYSGIHWDVENFIHDIKALADE